MAPRAMTPFERLDAIGLGDAAYYQHSRELWEMLDRCQRPDLAAELRTAGVADPVAAGLLPSDPEEPALSVLPQMTPEVLQAIAEADDARARVNARIDAMHERPAPRRADCGQKLTIHGRRDNPAGGVQDALWRPSCGRSDCPHCWRRRLEKTLRRATVCLLDASPARAAVRVGQLHVGETTWDAWEAYDKAMRREWQRRDWAQQSPPWPCGRLRLRRRDGSVLVIAERPWSGSRPVSPAEALDLVGDAVEHLHTARHAYRQLGAWRDQRTSGWRVLAKAHGCISLAEVRQQLAALGTHSHYQHNPDLAALYWRAPSAEAADALMAAVCPTLASRRRGSPTGQSRTGGGPSPVDDCPGEGPSPDEGPCPEEGCVFDADWWDPGPPPWET